MCISIFSDSLIGRAFKRGQFNYGKEAQEEQVFLVQGLVPFNRVVNHLPYQKYMKMEQRYREVYHPRGDTIDLPFRPMKFVW